MTVADTIERKLRQALTPERLSIIDDSHRHAGHAGARPEGETHFRVVIVSEAFTGCSRLDRHRRVNEILSEELADRVHALQLTARTPDEVRGEG